MRGGQAQQRPALCTPAMAAGLKSESYVLTSLKTKLIHQRSRHSLVLCPRRWFLAYHPFVCTLDELATSLGR